MSWMTSQDASSTLNISDRTLRRRLRAGVYPSRREGRTVQVELDVPDEADRLGDIGDHFARASLANAVTTRTAADTLAAVSDQHRSEVRVLRQGLVATTALGVLAVLSLAGVVWVLAVKYDATRSRMSEMAVGHVRQVVTLETAVADAVREVEVVNDRADARIAAADKRTVAAERRATDAEITANEILCVDQEPDVELHAAAGE